ncbi:hypothetical protein IEQ44_11575 [Nocardioides sp. Y6]|uniref:Uncharacterized protein n=1 Tax=Nocardioides malaquae TaxID=2773426 RepID=A0ABR9RUK9_9ACTN|nr:hypothetical protein [Nocardioides malaquae]MBE7325294.1 hypothetical protein [Nocardioides malaquae]
MAPGKRAGSRKAARPSPAVNKSALAYAGGITACVIAWGYLVYAAIDFGASARSGNAGAWFLLILAGIGAATCLFVGLMLLTRLGAALGVTRPPTDATDPDGGTAPPRPVGGRRAAR